MEEKNKPKNITPRTQMKIKQYFMRGLTSFLVILAGIVCYFAFLRLDDIAGLLGKIGGILQPIILGLVFAYLLNPLVTIIENQVIKMFEKKAKNREKLRKVSRSIGIAGSLLVAFAVVILLLNMVIPELYRSIRDLIMGLPHQINNAIDFLESEKIHDTAFSGTIKSVLENGAEAFQMWLKTDLLTQINQMMSFVTVGVFSVVETLFDIAVGVIVSVYVLNSKEKFTGQCKKITYALLSRERANLMLQITRKSHKIFGGFVIGKIIDSIIIGILCFIGLSILDIPYTLLVSVIVGVTNVVPFFGPYIGAIPSAILILLSEPIKGYFHSRFTTV